MVGRLMKGNVRPPGLRPKIRYATDRCGIGRMTTPSVGFFLPHRGFSCVGGGCDRPGFDGGTSRAE